MYKESYWNQLYGYPESWLSFPPSWRSIFIWFWRFLAKEKLRPNFGRTSADFCRRLRLRPKVKFGPSVVHYVVHSPTKMCPWFAPSAREWKSINNLSENALDFAFASFLSKTRLKLTLFIAWVSKRLLFKIPIFSRWDILNSFSIPMICKRN